MNEINNLIRSKYDALLVVSFGGPEKREDVLPFLENVLRGKNVPQQRMLEVAEHYYHFDGVSPINAQCRDLIAAINKEFTANEIDLPIYWGNRNWHPYLADTIAQMKSDGVQRVITFFTSLYSCYSGCRQYRENLFDACESVGGECPAFDKLRMPYNHPTLIEVQADALRSVIQSLPADLQEGAVVLFCAHSIPIGMANASRYVEQLQETARLTMERLSLSSKQIRWELVFQSRSGPPTQPWLEPDICDRIEQLHATDSIKAVVVHPIGFISDHMEVLFDLDHEAKETCETKQIEFRRVSTCSNDPRFAMLIRELIEERCDPSREKQAIGQYAANHDVCPANCCLSGRPGVESRPALAQRDLIADFEL
jgi:protoporphyrin/coproporphyrin ferrochelatase